MWKCWIRDSDFKETAGRLSFGSPLREPKNCRVVELNRQRMSNKSLLGKASAGIAQATVKLLLKELIHRRSPFPNGGNKTCAATLQS